MTAYDPLHPDLGQHAWHEEGGFFHGYINGVYSRMVCTPEEFEEVREKESQYYRTMCPSEELEEGCEEESQESETPPDNDAIWWALDEYVDPCDELYGEFESASPFEEDLDLESRRRIIAVNMYLDPDTATWYGLGKQYSLLMRLRRQEDWRKALQQRILALGLDPKMELRSETRRRRALAFEFGLNPYTATWDDIDRAHLELHKVVLPDVLARRARRHLDGKTMNVEDLLQRALEYYLDGHGNGSNEGDEKPSALHVSSLTRSKHSLTQK